MIIHIALFKWKDGTKENEIEDVLKKIRQMKEKCDGIISISCGKNFHKESKGFIHGVVVCAKNQASLDAYRRHPDHAEINKRIEKIEEDSLGFDFSE